MLSTDAKSRSSGENGWRAPTKRTRSRILRHRNQLSFTSKNPMAPTVHANYRYFERGLGEKEGSWWFGGGLI